jgi:hypothetical protein
VQKSRAMDQGLEGKKHESIYSDLMKKTHWHAYTVNPSAP